MIPVTEADVSLVALKAWMREKTILAALESFHQQLGNIFQMNLPGFKPVMLVGPEAARFVLVNEKEHLLWRSASDPVTALLRQGVLVIDGEMHDSIRGEMSPSLHRKMVETYVASYRQRTDEITACWQPEKPVDMLVEMRKIALLILMDTLYGINFSGDLKKLWTPILKSIAYISPGLWMVWRGVPRPGYQRQLRVLDDYLYQIIRHRRQFPADDLLGILTANPHLSDGFIRDQLLTLLIAGHDTSTALLTWVLFLLGKHPEALQKAQAEVDAVLQGEIPQMEHLPNLVYLEQVIDETLRLYPPIHLGSRVAAVDLEFAGYQISKGTRVLYSIYLTHRMAEYWPDPHRFC
ncbi:MAG: cytochrome P450, partial [Anaerolineae bacterium]|nr:cytochrome P450 [Anaerolineae bacterium]